MSSEQYQVDAYVVSGSIIQHSIEFGGARYLGDSALRSAVHFEVNTRDKS